jgi:hydroxymethylbilane synthase
VGKEGSPFLEQLRRLDDPVTRREVEAERHILRALGGGCSVPLGVWAKQEGGSIRLRASIFGGIPSKSVHIDLTFPVHGMKEGLDLAVDALRQGRSLS